jgi:hypothetical protein
MVITRGHGDRDSAEDIVIITVLDTEELGFQLRRLARHQYTDMPWDRLRQVFDEVDGVVTFGCALTPGHHDEGDPRVKADMRTSPWTYIEAAMAIEAAIPVLAVLSEGSVTASLTRLSGLDACTACIPATHPHQVPSLKDGSPPCVEHQQRGLWDNSATKGCPWPEWLTSPGSLG